MTLTEPNSTPPEGPSGPVGARKHADGARDAGTLERAADGRTAGLDPLGGFLIAIQRNLLPVIGQLERTRDDVMDAFAPLASELEKQVRGAEMQKRIAWQYARRADAARAEANARLATAQAETARAEARALRAAADKGELEQRIRELHPLVLHTRTCNGCGAYWPCPTITAIDTTGDPK